ncbi:MAG: 3-hydroxyacyl-CoA dehydrogenase family protein [Deltaproteobacteria bacterium]|nr:MAG: 3-hydroxyacyl-CoA dehydrogenase family protein [Deltaproteobacteria bacterium]
METKPFETVCIIGAGFMGAQIGLHCATHGYTVWFVDILEEELQRAVQRHSEELDARLEKEQITPDEKEAILSRTHVTTKIQEGAPKAQLVIESVPERLEIKHEVFTQLDEVCLSHTILATNSSSIRISAIEEVTNRPKKVLNMHFYPPVWQRTMVELMRGTATSDETIESVRQFVRTIDLTPLLVRRESTGFIFNRVWRAIKKECLHLVDNGVASHEDVDRAWMIATAMPAGPFGLMDVVGLDVVRDIEMVYYRESGDETDAPPKFLLDKIERGELGMKTGKGFYTYPNPAFQAPGWLKGDKEN